jgi:ribosomal-protein-alanine N-acetyltransferase
MMQKAENEFIVFRADADTPTEFFEMLAELEHLTIPDGWSAASFKSEAEKTCGYVIYVTYEDNIAALLTAYDSVYEGNITNVAVHPSYRRRGLAERMIAEFERLLPNDAESIFLEVRETNIAAISLYKKCGFEPVGIRKNFYSNPRENAVVMKKER